MSAQGFAAALEELGLCCPVEEQRKLAIIIPSPATTASLLLRATKRREIVALARSHGFTNVCVEIPAVHATVSCD